MGDWLNTFPTVGAQTLRALARYPDRIAFHWPGGSLSYRGATDMIGRFQSIFVNLGAQPGTRVALLTANRAETWCAGVAAQLSRFGISWLHPLGSLDDQIDQIEKPTCSATTDQIRFRLAICLPPPSHACTSSEFQCAIR